MILESILITPSALMGTSASGTARPAGPIPRLRWPEHLQEGPGYVNSDHATLTWDQAADYLIPASAGAQPKAADGPDGDWAAGEFDNKGFTDYGWMAAPGTDKIYDTLADSFACRPRRSIRPASSCSSPPRLGRGPGHLQPVQGLHPGQHHRRQPTR